MFNRCYSLDFCNVIKFLNQQYILCGSKILYDLCHEFLNCCQKQHLRIFFAVHFISFIIEFLLYSTDVKLIEVVAVNVIVSS